MDQPASTLLSPELLARLEKMELVSRKVFRGRMKGERRSPRKGQSVEFADFRNYVPGDDLRFVDWNTYARLEQAVLEDVSRRGGPALLRLDRRQQFDGFRQSDEAAVCRAVGGRARVHRAGARRSGQDRDDRPIGPRPPPPSAAAAASGGCSTIWQIETKKGSGIFSGTTKDSRPLFSSLAEGVKNFCLRNSGKGIVVLISDLMDKGGYESALRYLASRQMDVYVIHVLSPEEFDPDVQGDLRLVDCEDGDVAEVTITVPLMKRYKQTLAAFVDSARDSVPAAA